LLSQSTTFDYISNQAIKKLTESIKRFGLVDPLIVNSAPKRTNFIIGGHFRFKVAKDLGIKKVPVVFLDIPDIEKEKELNLRLNRNTGDWDFELLKSFDIEMLLDIGFDETDLSDIWDEHLFVEDDEFDVEEEISKIKVPEVRPGDIYRLDPHVLGCGDATDPSFISKLVGKSRPDMVYIDPPYNISLDYNSGIGTKGKYGGFYTRDNKTDEEYRDFLTKAISSVLKVVKVDAHIFCYCDQSYIGMLQDIYKELGIDNKRVCLWIKGPSNPTPQIAFSKSYEPCLYGTVGSPYLSSSMKNLSELLNKEIDSGNRTIDDILDILDIWLVKRLNTKDYVHPTEKPPTLHEKPIRRCTRVGDTVLDTFSGSGSSLVACHELKRKCIISDIEPIFCDLIIRRYKNLTGEKVYRVSYI